MRKLLSLVIVLLLISVFFPVALASDTGTTYPICPDCGNTEPDCVCSAKKPSPTPTPVPHICSFGIFESNGDGTHTAICSGNFYHRFVEECYSDNNRNHKCDHCAYIMSEHEFSYAPESSYTHKASCYCGEEHVEPCSFVDDKCVKCENICRIYNIDSEVLDELNVSGSSESLSADSLRRDMLNIDYGVADSFRADISQQALDKIRSENPDIGISVGNDRFNMLLGASFLDRLDEGVYVESKSHDDGFAFELGSGSKQLVELDTKGISSHWGASSLRCQLDCAPAGEPESATELLSVGLSSDEGSFASISKSQLEYERELIKTRYRLNTVDYPYAQTEYDMAHSRFAMLEQPQVEIRLSSLDDWDAPEAYVLVDGDGSYQLAPDDEGCYEADLLLSPGREMEIGIKIRHF